MRWERSTLCQRENSKNQFWRISQDWTFYKKITMYFSSRPFKLTRWKWLKLCIVNANQPVISPHLPNRSQWWCKHSLVPKIVVKKLVGSSKLKLQSKLHQEVEIVSYSVATNKPNNNIIWLSRILPKHQIRVTHRPKSTCSSSNSDNLSSLIN